MTLSCFGCILILIGSFERLPSDLHRRLPISIEVVRRHMIGPFWPQPDARAVVQPKASPLGLFLRSFQRFLPPDAVDALHAHLPALVREQAANAPVANS